MGCVQDRCYDIFCLGHKTLHEKRKHGIYKNLASTSEGETVFGDDTTYENIAWPEPRSRSEHKRFNVLRDRPLDEGVYDD